MVNDTVNWGNDMGVFSGTPLNAYETGHCLTMCSALKNGITTSELHPVIAAPTNGRTIFLWGWAAATAGNSNSQSLVAGLRNTGESVNKIRVQSSLPGPQFVRLAVPVEFPDGVTLDTIKTAELGVGGNNYLTLIYTLS